MLCMYRKISLTVGSIELSFFSEDSCRSLEDLFYGMVPPPSLEKLLQNNHQLIN